jgi:nucleoside phosphorylase
LPIIHTALHSEAHYIKERLHCRKVCSLRKIEIFYNDPYVLVVSGVGKVATSVGVTFAAQMFPKSTDLFLNYGIAGSTKKHWKLGEIRLANKIVDLATNRSYFPDQILQSSFLEASIGTSEKPVVRDNLEDRELMQNSGEFLLSNEDASNPLDLYDMEASSFFQSANFYADSHRIHSIKLISDHLEGKFCLAKDVENWSVLQVEPIINFLETQLEWLQTTKPTQTENSWLDIFNEIIENLHLTKTQSEILKKSLEFYFRDKNKNPNLDSFLTNSVDSNEWRKYLYKSNDSKSKNEGKIRLNHIMNFFYNRLE